MDSESGSCGRTIGLQPEPNNAIVADNSSRGWMQGEAVMVTTG